MISPTASTLLLSLPTFLARGEGGMAKKYIIRRRLGAEVHPRRAGAEISLLPLPTMHCRPGGKEGEEAISR